MDIKGNPVACLVALIVVLGFLPSAAVADHQDSPWRQSGLALVSAVGLNLNECSPNAPTNGVVNTVMELPDETVADGNHSFLITNSAYLFTHPEFFSDDSGSCESDGDGGTPPGFLGGDRVGTVPEGSDYVSVEHYVGAGQWELAIPNPRCAQSPFC